MAFRWPGPPFGLPKHLQNESQKGAKDTAYQKVKIELSLQPELDPEGCEGAENHNFSMFFWNIVLGWLWEPIFVNFGSLWGAPLGLVLLTFGGPFWELWKSCANHAHLMRTSWGKMRDSCQGG